MSSKHPFLVAGAFAVSLIACGGSSDSEEEVIVPAGPHYGYVVSHAIVPTSDAQIAQYSLDVGTKTSAKKLDGSPDNGLGQIISGLTLLASQGGTTIDLQGSVTKAVDQGTVNLLVDFQTESFTTSDAAGFSVKLGATSTPAACTDANDTTCRHQLNGDATFTLDPNSPANALVAGKIVSGNFDGGPGNVSVSLAIGGAAPVTIDLLHARVRATGISETGITSAIIAGMVVEDTLLQAAAPVALPLITNYLATNCTGDKTQSCGCTGIVGTLVKAIDTDSNCVITNEELIAGIATSGFVNPDVCSTDSCSTADAISLGVGIEAVKATFPM